MPRRDLWTLLLADKTSPVDFWDSESGRFTRSSWPEVLVDARRCGAGLRAAGLAPGQAVAAVLTNSPACVSGLLGVWCAGGVLASLPVPARGLGLAEYGAQIVGFCERMGAGQLLVDRTLRDAVAQLVSAVNREIAVESWEAVGAVGAVGASSSEPAPPPLADTAFIQFSSGSTGQPKGCVLSAGALAEQLHLLGELTEVRPRVDVGVSWLPLSHDMGLIGCLLYALAWDLPLVFSTPERFLRSPRTWFGDVADAGGTVTAGTSSALHLAARAQRSQPVSHELALRLAIVGAERIHWGTLERVAEAFGPAGLTLREIMPAFGLAEAALAVTSVRPAELPKAVTLDGVALAEGELQEVASDAPHATPVVCLGRPCDEVRLGFDAPGRLSEIQVWSPSLAAGYLGDPDLTAARFVDGGVRTGDLGFERDGELYVVGRSDDMLSLRGRNVYTREVEATVDQLPGVRGGCSTIVDATDSERTRLVMLVELRDRQSDVRGIAAAAARCAMTKAGISVDEFTFLPPGTLPKTPSGKTQRFRCRQLLATGQLETIASVFAEEVI